MRTELLESTVADRLGDFDTRVTQQLEEATRTFVERADALDNALSSRGREISSDPG